MALHCSLRLRAPPRSFVCSLAQLLGSELMGKRFLSMEWMRPFHIISTHCALFVEWLWNRRIEYRAVYSFARTTNSYSYNFNPLCAIATRWPYHLFKFTEITALDTENHHSLSHHCTFAAAPYGDLLWNWRIQFMNINFYLMSSGASQ